MRYAAFFIALIAAGIVCVDAGAVTYGIHVGMKYPFMAAAVANMAIVVLTQVTGIIWMLTRI